jgi:hypothetical protein
MNAVIVRIGGYILVNIKTGMAAHCTFATNRPCCWKAAERYESRASLKAQGWKCVWFSGETTTVDRRL